MLRRVPCYGCAFCTWLFKSSNPEIYWRNPWEHSLAISNPSLPELCIWRKKSPASKWLWCHTPWRLATDKNVIESESCVDQIMCLERREKKSGMDIERRFRKSGGKECSVLTYGPGHLLVGVCRLFTECCVCGQQLVAAFVCPSSFSHLFSPFPLLLLTLLFSPHTLHYFLRFVPMDVTHPTRYPPVSYVTSPFWSRA